MPGASVQIHIMPEAIGRLSPFYNLVNHMNKQIKQMLPLPRSPIRWWLVISLRSLSSLGRGFLSREE
jgi:hypothetical protein